MENPITRAEHNEFCKRMEDEHNRINHRVKDLEEQVREIAALTASVQRLADNMASMLKIQEKQGNRLEVLEARDGKMWRKVVEYVVLAIVGILIGFVFAQIGIS